MKRRLTKMGDKRYRGELPGGLLTELSYFEKHKKWDEKLQAHRDLGPEETSWALYWEGVMMDTFLSEEAILCYIIRFVYSIEDTVLIPSEILADFNLVYKKGNWVDSWFSTDYDEVVLTTRDIVRPSFRKLRFKTDTAHYSRSPRHKHKPKKVGFWEKLLGVQGYTPKSKIQYPEIPDEECIFSLKAGEAAESAHTEKRKLFLSLQKG